MKEYIERDDALKAVTEFFEPVNTVDQAIILMNHLLKKLMLLTAADVVERKRGEWIYHECVSSHDGTISGYSCSKCNAFVNEETFDMDEFHKDFCGHCGADMRGEKHEQTE